MTDKMRQQILAAGKAKKAELVLKDARIVNVFTETVEEADIAIEAGMIVGIGSYEGETEVDLGGDYVCPGFLDGHIHMESSMVAPEEFERLVLPHGTTAVITDPHEIANVAGVQGIRYMMESTGNLTLDVFFMMPSCVPSTPLDEAGATLSAADLKPFYEDKRVLGLAEMMNSFGTVRGDGEILQKIADARERGKIVDGHAPFLSGADLNAYVAAGVRSDHECSVFEEAREKLARGQWIMVREGTAAKNLERLMPLFEAPYYQRAMLVTDDRHPGDLLRGGHIDEIIRKAVQWGADPIRAIKMGTWNTASCFGLSTKGAVAPGYEADLVVFASLKELRVKAVYKAGRPVVLDGVLLSGTEQSAPRDSETKARVFHSFHLPPITGGLLELKQEGPNQRVIDLVDHELITRERIVPWKNHEGFAPGVDTKRDIVKLAVFERHCNTGHAGIGFLGRYGLKKGAVATSIGHDSHNLVIAGTCDEDMLLAGNRVIDNEGGLAIAVDGVVVADLPLKIAGIMADLPAQEVDERLEHMKEILKELGIPDEIDGFMTLAFVSLPVIPQLRLNTYGIVDVGKQQIVKASFS